MTKSTDNKKATVTKNATVQSAQEESLAKLKVVLEQKNRSKQDKIDVEPEPPKVSLGPAGAIVDALLNTAPSHILELTDFDRNQVSLVPQVVVIDDMWDYLEQSMSYRSDSKRFAVTYKRLCPEIPETSRKFVFTLAQTRRSLGGKMKKALEDMALAELENKSMDDSLGGVGGHDFED